jgi:hypothetical protein
MKLLVSLLNLYMLSIAYDRPTSNVPAFPCFRFSTAMIPIFNGSTVIYAIFTGYLQPIFNGSLTHTDSSSPVTNLQTFSSFSY